MNKFSDEQKIAFFDANWEYIDRILNVLQDQTKNYIRPGTRLLEFLADWLERNFEVKN